MLSYFESLIENIETPRCNDVSPDAISTINYNDYQTAISEKFCVLYKKSKKSLYVYGIKKRQTRKSACPDFSTIAFLKPNILVGYSNKNFYQLDLKNIFHDKELIPIAIETKIQQVTKIGVDNSSENRIFCFSESDNTIYRVNLSESNEEPEIIFQDVDLYSPAKDGIFLSKLNGLFYYSVDNSNINEVFNIPIVDADLITGGDSTFTAKYNGTFHIFNRIGKEIEGDIPPCHRIVDQGDSVLFIDDKKVFFVEPYFGEIQLQIVGGGILNNHVYYWTDQCQCFFNPLPNPKTVLVPTQNKPQTNKEIHRKK